MKGEDQGGEPSKADHKGAVPIEPVVGVEQVLGPRPERPNDHEPNGQSGKSKSHRSRANLLMSEV